MCIPGYCLNCRFKKYILLEHKIHLSVFFLQISSVRGNIISKRAKHQYHQYHHNENMEDEFKSDWTPKDSKTKTDVERCYKYEKT